MNYSELLREMNSGVKHLLILGRAGSGKSKLVQDFIANTDRAVLVTAPTGRATMQIPKAVTNHAAFGLRPTVAFPWEPRLTEQAIAAIQQMDTLLMDEISMVRMDVYLTIDALLRKIRGKDEPLGGARFIGVGDLYQLPPVAKELDVEYIRNLAKDRQVEGFSFLLSPAFANPEVFRHLKVFELRGSFRQTAEDDQFRDILDRIRFGHTCQQDIDLLNTRVIRRNPKGLPILTSTRGAKNHYNALSIAQLPGPIHFSPPSTQWHEDEVQNLIDDEPAARVIPLGVGMRVMFFKNHPVRLWVNGTMGTITNVETSEGSEISRLSVLIDGMETPVHVERQWFDVFVPYFNAAEGRDCSKPVATIQQFPVEPGYAITIHKSQGMTIDAAIIDLGRGAFAPGQLYVALSRIKSFDGLHLASPLKLEDCMASVTASVFYQRIATKLTPVFPGAV